MTDLIETPDAAEAAATRVRLSRSLTLIAGQLAEAKTTYDTIIDQRYKLVNLAKDAGLTYKEIADLIGVANERGAYKIAQRGYKDPPRRQRVEPAEA